MADYGPRAPHGPDMSDSKNGAEMDVHEKTAFDSLLRPADSYSPEVVYWADMPLLQRIRYVGSYDAQEAKRELGSIGSMMKADLLAPIGYYFKNMVLPGAGLGLEGLVCLSLI